LYSLEIPDRFRRYQNVLSLLPAAKVDGLFRDGVLEHDTGDKILECWQDLTPLTSETDDLGGFQFLELRSTLPDELLMYADKLSMAHGLEVRVPYLDKNLVEYVERLPAEFKVRNGIGKWLHRRVSRTMLPKNILQRKKRGFAVNVVDDWFRSAMGNRLNDLLLDGQSHLYEFLRPDAVREMLDEHHSGRRDNHKVLFSLVVLEAWLREHKSLTPSGCSV
jgi:asparagine synthase (glutamine-hydrolysing)